MFCREEGGGYSATSRAFRIWFSALNVVLPQPELESICLFSATVRGVAGWDGETILSGSASVYAFSGLSLVIGVRWEPLWGEVALEKSYQRTEDSTKARYLNHLSLLWVWGIWVWALVFIWCCCVQVAVPYLQFPSFQRSGVSIARGFCN